ncbi:MAG: DUF4422 domain-containing protein [Prevotella sp.]
MTDVKIMVCAHKRVKLPEHRYFLPVQAGTALHDCIDEYAPDNTGENISSKNPHFCELTCHYWFWKNVRADIVGLNHYRRYFDFQRRWKRFSPDRSFTTIDYVDKPYSFPDLDLSLKSYDIILPPKRHYPYSVGTQYKVFHLVNDLNILREVIADLSPDYLPSFDHLMNNENGYSGYNMFITRWKHFDCYSEWMFNILFEVERRVKLSPYPDQARIFGYMSERLINVYCMRHNLRVKYVPVIMPIVDRFVNPSNLRYCYWRLKNTLAFKLFKIQ